jgi:hypothetical protein
MMAMAVLGSRLSDHGQVFEAESILILFNHSITQLLKGERTRVVEGTEKG